jgi:hypothetical protein
MKQENTTPVEYFIILYEKRLKGLKSPLFSIWLLDSPLFNALIVNK